MTENSDKPGRAIADQFWLETTEKARLAKLINEAIEAARPTSAGQSDGTSSCPICGIDTPHKHSAQEARGWREGEAWVQQSWGHFQEKYADKFRAAEMGGDLRRAEQWLRAISEWLLTTNNDMNLPDGILDTDPLDLADMLAALSSPPKDNS